MLEPQFPKRFQLLKMHKLFSQDRRAKSSTIVSRNSRLLLRLVIHQRTLTRSTRIRSWFCHISESIEGPISSPLLMDMVSMVNLSVSTLRLSLHRRSNSPLSTHSIRLKLTSLTSLPLTPCPSATSRNSRLLLKLVIHQRTLTRSTRIRSWFCHISESIEGPISSPLLMDMVSMVNLSVSTLRLSLHRRSNSPLSTHSIRLKLTRE